MAGRAANGVRRNTARRTALPFFALLLCVVVIAALFNLHSSSLNSVLHNVYSQHGSPAPPRAGWLSLGEPAAAPQQPTGAHKAEAADHQQRLPPIAPQPQPQRQPLLITPAPPVDTHQILQQAIAHNDTRLARMARLLAQHRTLVAASGDKGPGNSGSTTSSSSSSSAGNAAAVAAARGAYRKALDAFMLETSPAAGAAPPAGGGAPVQARPWIPGRARGGGAAGTTAAKRRLVGAAGAGEDDGGSGDGQPATATSSSSSSSSSNSSSSSSSAASMAAPAEGPAAAPAAQLIAEALAAVRVAAANASAVCGGEPVVVPCRRDVTQTTRLRGDQRVLLAANLRSCQGVMPNFVVQVLSLELSGGGQDLVCGGGGFSSSSSSSSSSAAELAAERGDVEGATAAGKAALGSSQLFVQIYESNSTDSTGRWLQLLQLLLEPIGVPSNITINGTLTRQPSQDRIEYLAGVRNALLPPLDRGRRGGGQRSEAAVRSRVSGGCISCAGWYLQCRVPTVRTTCVSASIALTTTPALSMPCCPSFPNLSTPTPPHPSSSPLPPHYSPPTPHPAVRLCSQRGTVRQRCLLLRCGRAEAAAAGR